MNIAYVRVSSVEQNEGRQVEALKKYGIEKWFIEKVSAKNKNRAQLQTMLEFAREGDTIFIHDFSRLARSTIDLLDLVGQLENKNVRLVSSKENLDTTTPTGRLMLTMIAAINEFERMNLLERQREGIEIAKRNGVYKGRNTNKVDEDLFRQGYEKYKNREISKSKLAELIGVSRPTLYRIMKERDLI